METSTDKRLLRLEKIVVLLIQQQEIDDEDVRAELQQLLEVLRRDVEARG